MSPGATTEPADAGTPTTERDPAVGEDPRDQGAPRLFHPLMGSGLAHLVGLLREHGPVPLGRLPHVGLALAASLLRWPFTAWERRSVAGRVEGEDAVHAPVFIVGHWRSGTTHLYNILGKAPDFGFVDPLATGLPWEFLGLGRALEPLLTRALPSDRFIDRVPVEPDSPQEDEAALANMQPLSFYHGLYFPRDFESAFRRGVFFEDCTEDEIRRWERCFVHFLRKVSLRAGGRRLLVKNPVYTARVARIRKLFPGARFIHIHRNPYVVFQSTRHFYHRLFPNLALQDWSHVPVDRVILESYPRMMHRLLEDAAELPPGDFVEVAFDDLEEDPLATVRRIYDVLGLEGFDRAREPFRAYLRSVRDYEKNRYRFRPDELEAVERHWGEFLERWGYERPPEAA